MFEAVSIYPLYKMPSVQITVIIKLQTLFNTHIYILLRYVKVRYPVIELALIFYRV